MTAHVKDGGTWKTLTGLHVKDAGTWKAVSAGYVKDAGTWKQFYGAGGGGGGGGVSVSIDPSPANAFRQLNNFNTSGYVSKTVVGTPVGFTSPVYSWSRVSGASVGGAFTPSSYTAASTTIGATIPVFQECTETWRLTVTEASNPAIFATADVVVTLELANLS